MQAERFPYSTYSRSLHITCPRSRILRAEMAALCASEYCTNILQELSITPLFATLTNVLYKYGVSSAPLSLSLMHARTCTHIHSLFPSPSFSFEWEEVFLSFFLSFVHSFFLHRAHQESFSSCCEAIAMNKTFRSPQFVLAST